jgi:GNAT superfamily N-acetyltransferase
MIVASESTAPVSTVPSAEMGIHIFDNVLQDAAAYRAMALAQPFGDVTLGEQTFRGIAVAPDDTLTQVIRRVWRSDASPTLSFFRLSPHAQPEPNFVHSDAEMGAWTAVLYLNPDPPAGDGTGFWHHASSGMVRGSSKDAVEDGTWQRYRHVEAAFGRLLIFQSDYFHARGLIQNYGTDAQTARLVQVAFGGFAAPSIGIREATEADVPAIVAMAERFVSSTSYHGFMVLDPLKVAGLTARLIADPDGVCFVAEREGRPLGMLALHVFDHPMSTDRIASELVWWGEPDARGSGMRLLRAAERWATAHGATVLQMVAPTAAVGDLYRRLGFAPVEISYQKRRI